MGLLDILMGKPKQTNSPTIQYRRNPYSDTYIKNMEKIESMWSVLQNLRIYTGDQADTFESLCYQNIDEYHRMADFDRQQDAIVPAHAPCYVRLCMLYEKRQDYQKGIDICVEAIQSGADKDGQKGMHGRLARLIRKSGIDVNPDILKLTQEG